MTALLYSLVDELVAELAHLEPNVEVRHEYLPRGLPARECLGFVTLDPLRFMFNFGRTIASDNIDTAIYAAFDKTPVRRDQMGRRQIVYFPEISIEWLE